MLIGQSHVWKLQNHGKESGIYGQRRGANGCLKKGSDNIRFASGKMATLLWARPGYTDRRCTNYSCSAVINISL